MTVHPLVESILTTRRTLRPDGGEIDANSFIPRDECELVYESIMSSGAKRGVEVGMAFGVSSLCIADALQRNDPQARLVSIDSHQTVGWYRAGAHLVERAGYGSMLTLIEEPSQLALPRMVAAGERFDFGFIDGWHTFDHTLIDFFFIDRMLEPGSFIVFDDVGYPAINAVVRFILSNRDYELVKALQYPDAQLPPVAVRARRAIKRSLRPLARTDRDPKPRHEALFRRIENVHSVALRKRDEDTRRFDHFERF